MKCRSTEVLVQIESRTDYIYQSGIIDQYHGRDAPLKVDFINAFCYGLGPKNGNSDGLRC